MTRNPAAPSGSNVQEIAVSPKLTEARLRILRSADRDPRSLVDRPYMTGFERANWDRNAAYLASASLLTPYVHGGFEITEAGRLALRQQESRTS